MLSRAQSALEPIWHTIESLLPPPRPHPLGCHNPALDPHLVFERIVFKCVTGCSWDDASFGFCDESTLRKTRDRWQRAGVFELVWAEVLEAYDQVVGVQADLVMLDGCITKAPCGGEASGKSPVDRRKSGTKRSMICDRRGVPLAWVIEGANRHDMRLFPETLLLALEDGRLESGATLLVDRGYDYDDVRGLCALAGIDVKIPPPRRRGEPKDPLGGRWRIEGLNSHLNRYGAVRCQLDRRRVNKEVMLLLACCLFVTRRLIQAAEQRRGRLRRC